MAKLTWVDVGVWTNNTLYLRGNYATDPDTSAKYYNAIQHTSAAAGTFADDRTAHPLYWRLLLQDIPAEYLDAYRKAVSEPVIGHIIRKRCPYRIPTMQSILGHPSAAQLEQRSYFKQCVECYNKQPQSGGATPPDIGPRARSWWYTAAIGSGLWYFDYFIKQSLALFMVGTTPDWCKEPVTVKIADSNVTSTYWPDDVYHNAPQMFASEWYSYGSTSYQRIWLINPKPTMTKLWLLPFDITKQYNPMDYLWIEIYNVPGGWNPATLKWNNQPGLGALLKSVEILYWGQWNWLPIDIGTAWTYICIKMLADVKGRMYANGAGHSNQTYRPYVSNA